MCILISIAGCVFTIAEWIMGCGKYDASMWKAIANSLDLVLSSLRFINGDIQDRRVKNIFQGNSIEITPQQDFDSYAHFTNGALFSNIDLLKSQRG